MVERSNPESREFYWPTAVKQPQTMDVCGSGCIFFMALYLVGHRKIIRRVIKLKAL